MTTYLTTIGTRISKRSLFHKLITGCGPVGRALDLGSRRREFESPHSDHKNRCFQTKTAVFNTFMHISFEPTASSAPHQESSLKSLFFVYCMPIFVRRYISFHIIETNSHLLQTLHLYHERMPSSANLSIHSASISSLNSSHVT